jgi:hypothetical protein
MKLEVRLQRGGGFAQTRHPPYPRAGGSWRGAGDAVSIQPVDLGRVTDMRASYYYIGFCLALALVAGLALSPASSSAQPRVSICTIVPSGATQDVTAFSVCRRITNSTGKNLCALTGTEDLWNKFRARVESNAVANVSMVACPPANCTAPWGATVNNGSSVTAYSTNLSANCASVSELRVCTNGTLSGSFTNQTCSAPANCPAQTVTWAVGANTCSASSAAINHNGTSTVSSTATGRTGSVTLTCNNGVLAQSGASCASCSFKLITRTLTPSGHNLGTYDDFRFGPTHVCQSWGYTGSTGKFQCAYTGQSESRHNGGWGHIGVAGQGWCTFTSPNSGVEWVECYQGTPGPSCTPLGTPVNGGWSAWSAWSNAMCWSCFITSSRSRSCTNPMQQNGGQECSGYPTETSQSGGCCNMSDARLKHDITPIFAGEGLKILAGLNPVSYKWNEGNRADIGVIAQEVEKVLPAAVSKTKDGFLGVAYDKLILPVIAAVRELQAKLEKIAADLTAFADRQNAFEKRLVALEAENAALKNSHSAACRETGPGKNCHSCSESPKTGSSRTIQCDGSCP